MAFFNPIRNQPDTCRSESAGLSSEFPIDRSSKAKYVLSFPAKTMAAATCRCNSVVFVGNIPYHASEEELRSVCEDIGPVVSLRVATDKATGRRRGFAFCEYLDDETALSACRNLDGRALRGRDLRVRLADRQRGAGGGGGVDDHQPVGEADATHAAAMVSAPPGKGAVTAYLAGLSRRQLQEMLDVVAAADATLVEAARRDYGGFATLIDQAQVLYDMGKEKDDRRGGRKHASEPAAGQDAPKHRRLDDGKFVAGGVACR